MYFADYRVQNVQLYRDRLPSVIRLLNPISYIHFSEETEIRSLYGINYKSLCKQDDLRLLQGKDLIFKCSPIQHFSLEVRAL